MNRPRDGLYCIACGGKLVFEDDEHRVIVHLAFSDDIGIIIDNQAFWCPECRKLHWSDGSEVVAIQVSLVKAYVGEPGETSGQKSPVVLISPHQRTIFPIINDGDLDYHPTTIPGIPDILILRMDNAKKIYGFLQKQNG